MTHPFLIPSPYESDGDNLIGQDPRTISEAEWAAHMPNVLVGMEAIRAKCLDCAENAAEVRKCPVVSCSLWPLRMGSQPPNLRKVRKAASGQPADAASEEIGDTAPEMDGEA